MFKHNQLRGGTGLMHHGEAGTIPARLGRSGYRRTVSPSRGLDASRLRETFPALPKRAMA